MVVRVIQIARLLITWRADIEVSFSRTWRWALSRLGRVPTPASYRDSVKHADCREIWPRPVCAHDGMPGTSLADVRSGSVNRRIYSAHADSTAARMSRESSRPRCFGRGPCLWRGRHHEPLGISHRRALDAAPVLGGPRQVGDEERRLSSLCFLLPVVSN